MLGGVAAFSPTPAIASQQSSFDSFSTEKLSQTPVNLRNLPETKPIETGVASLENQKQELQTIAFDIGEGKIKAYYRCKNNAEPLSKKFPSISNPSFFKKKYIGIKNYCR